MKKALIIIACATTGCTTTKTTTTFPDGRIVTEEIRRADGKTLRVLAGAGADILSSVAAAEIARRAQEQNGR